MYQERPSALGGSTVWRRLATPGQVRILPDGCMDLIWTSRGDLFVAGPDTRPHILTSQPGLTHNGIRFASGVGPEVVGVAAFELVNERVALADIWGPSEARRLTERLAASEDPGVVLEAAAAERLRATGGIQPVIAEVVRLLRAGTPVAVVADRVGLSERHLHRRSLDAFGYGPKTLARIMRLGQAMDLARAGAAYADVAAEAGYADQAHLAREVRALADTTMKQLAG
jgi:AraC-like DNA-binding protein